MKGTTATVVVLLLHSVFSGTALAGSNKPNILVIWGDDIGWSNVGAYNRGRMGYATPNIDRIANEGMFGLLDSANAVPENTKSRSITTTVAVVPFITFHLYLEVWNGSKTNPRPSLT